MSSLPLRRVVLDTDTYNEVDDQFALAHLVLSSEKVQLDAVYAAPFLNQRSKSPEDGMEKSYEEIHRVLDLLQPKDRPPTFRGSKRFLESADGVAESEAASDLIERALKVTNEKLYVLTIGAPTNVASAINLEPRIADKIVVVWLGGNAPYWHTASEFNLKQDIHASRVLLDAKAPLVFLPCFPITSHLITTVAELESQLAPFSKLGAYLTKCVAEYKGNPPGWSKVIWDIGVSAWSINPEWIPTYQSPSPVLGDDLKWEASLLPRRPTIEIARNVKRDAIFADFFAKAKNCGS